MMENESIKKTLHELNSYYAAKWKEVKSVDELVHEPVDREITVDFWKLSNGEIEREMWNRLSSLDADADCLPGGPISSHRSWLGKPIVLLKKILRSLTGPYSSMLLQKQNRLNREWVTFQLLVFLKLRHLEKRINEMEDKMADFPDAGPAEAEAVKKTGRTR